MPAIRIRKPFLASFVALLLGSAYLGLSTQKIPSYGQSDKGLHLVTFFLLTLSFYWILETTRRRSIHLTLLTITLTLGLGSEIAQALLPNDRPFDPYDILANLLGSGAALGICSWYHKRMLERRRKNKNYDIVPGAEEDVELGLVEGQEEGVVVGGGVGEAQAVGGARETDVDVTEELDRWDENAEDWEDGPGTPGGKGEGLGGGGEGEKKRAD